MRTKRLALALLSLTSSLKAQHFDWVSALSGYNSGYGYAIDLDSAGNVVTAGEFHNSFDFDPGPDEYILEPFNYTDGYISKLTPTGDFIWARAIGQKLDDRVNDVVCDNSGFTYSTGRFADSLDFDPSAAIHILNGEVGMGFVLKYDYGGWLEWVVALGAEGHSIALDEEGYLYVTGTFEGSVDLDPGPDSLGFSSNGGEDVFIVKINAADGELIWAKQIGGAAGDDESHSITVSEQGNVFISGLIMEEADLDPGPGTTLAGSGNNETYFVLKLDDNGNLIWPLTIKAFPNVSNVSQVAVDDNENVYLSGVLYETMDFDPGPNSYPFTSNGMHDVFIAKYDAGANINWVTNLGGNGADIPGGLAVDHEGNIYSAGFIKDTVSFLAGTIQLISHGASDAYVAKYSSDGSELWAGSFGSLNGDFCEDIVVNSEKDIFVSGSFQKTVDFDPGPNVYEIEHDNNYDVFILKLSSCPNHANVLANGQLTFCEGDSVELSVDVTGTQYEWSSGSFNGAIVAYDEGDYWVTVTDDEEECEITSDTVAIQILQTNVEIITYPNQNLLESSVVASSYQWYLNGEPIVGATDELYEATSSGNYHLVITDDNGCEAESPLLEYTLQVGVEELSEVPYLVIVPNPNSGSFTITGNSLQQVLIMDATGKLVRQLNGGQRTQMQIEGLSSGLYLVRAQMADGSVENAKVVVQQ